MPRCGCNEQCTCHLKATGHGITTSGVGSTENPFVIDFDGSNLWGDGVVYRDGKLHVRYGTGLGLGPNGELIATGDRPSPEPGGGATVEALIQRGKDVVGGALGGGWMITPQCTKQAVEYGVERGLDLMYLVVRPLADGTPAVVLTEKMGAGNQLPLTSAVAVEDVTPQQWHQLYSEPGIWAEPAPPEKDQNPDTGWFGWLARNQRGLLLLADVLRVVENRCVLLLDLRFPADVVNSPEIRVTGFLRAVRNLLGAHRSTRSTIITTETPSFQYGQSTVDVFSYFQDVFHGPLLNSPEAAQKYPAESFPDDWTFAILATRLPLATMQTYAEAGKNVLLTFINRQYHRDALVEKVPALGVISADPEHYAAQIANHPTLGGRSYRTEWPNRARRIATVPGLLPPDTDSGRLDQPKPEKRAGMVFTSDYIYMGATMNRADGLPYNVLHGYLGKIPTDPAQGYAIEVSLAYDPNLLPEAHADNHLLIGFGFNHDYAFDWWKTLPEGVPTAEQYSGYAVTYSSTRGGGPTYYRKIGLCAIDTNSPTEPVKMEFNAGSPENGKLHTLLIGVNAKGVRLQHAHSGGGWGEVGQVTEPIATRDRGPYIYLGRRNRQGSATPNYTGIFALPKIRFGNQYGPQ